MAHSWFRSLLQRQRPPRPRSPRGKGRQATARPRLEALESRLAPATWDGGGTTNNWSDRFNWVGDAIPAAGDSLNFPATSGPGGIADPNSLQNVLDANFPLNRAFSGVTFSGRDYVITAAPGQSLQILGGTISNATTGSNALNVNINFGSTNLTVSTSGGNLTLGGVLEGSGNITKTGAFGRVILANNNPNFTGLMTVNGGAIVVASNQALGATTNGTVVNSSGGSHASLELDGGVAVGTESLSLNGFPAKLLNRSGNNSWAGSVFFPGDNEATLRGITAVAGQLTITGVVSSSADESGFPVVDVEGAGTVVFAGNASNTHAGTFRVSGGNLVLQKSGGAQAIVGALDVINGGTVRWAASDQISNTVPVRVQLGTLNLNGFNETIGPLSLDAATITTGAGTLILNSNVTQGIASGPSGTSTIAGKLSLGNTSRTFTVNPTGLTDDLVISAVIQAGSNIPKLIKEGTGRLVLSGANQYTGQTLVNAGRLTITNSLALGADDPNASFLADGTDVIGDATLELRADAGSFTVANENLRIGGTGAGGGRGGALRNLSGNNTWAGSVQFTTFFGDTISVGVDGSSQLTLDGNTFGGASSATIAKVGTGKLIFAGGTLPSDINGTFEIRAGIVNAQGSERVGEGDPVIVFSGAALELENRTATFNQPVQLNGFGINNTGALRLINGTATVSSPISLNSDAFIGVASGATLTQTGIISGPSASDLRKVGAGNLVLTAANNHAGSTVVSQGTLTMRNALALGTTANGTTVQPGGTLTIDGAFTVSSEALTLGIAGIAGEPVLAMLGANRDTSSWTGAINLNNDATIRVQGAISEELGQDGTGVTLQLPGPITSPVGATLTKTGLATLALTGSTSNTDLEGGVVVNAGTLQLAKTGGVQALDSNLIIGDGIGAARSARVVLANAGQIPNTKDVTVNRDGLFNLNNRNETIDELDLTGGAVSTGTGILSLSQVNSLAAADTAVIDGKLSAAVNTINIFVFDGSADPDLVINATLSSPVNRSGPGTLILNGNITNSSSLLLTNGTTFVNGSQPTSTVDVAGAGVGTPELAGTGTVGRINLRNGIVDPGAAVGQTGILTATNGLVVSTSTVAGASRKIEVDLNGGLVAGANYDQLSVITTVNLGTNLTQLVVNTPAGFTANPGDAFVILSNDGTTDLVSGQFLGLAEGATLTINGQPFRISYRGVNGNDNDVVLIRNTGSMFPNRSVTAVVTEGGFATLTGTISEPDPLDYFILKVNWGDGTPTETHIFPPGSPRQVSLYHRYLDNPAGGLSGQYPVQLEWHDQHGEGNRGVLSVTVQNANPAVLLGGNVTLQAGQTLSRTGSVLDPGQLDRHTVTVDYGDGSGLQELNLRRDGSFHLRHRYDRPGLYLVRVTVTDDDGGVGTYEFFVEVR